MKKALRVLPYLIDVLIPARLRLCPDTNFDERLSRSNLRLPDAQAVLRYAAFPAGQADPK
jgi:hypothetical protein